MDALLAEDAANSSFATEQTRIYILKRQTMNISDATPFIFFTGKGGVGKTSLASATAIRLAESGMW